MERAARATGWTRGAGGCRERGTGDIPARTRSLSLQLRRTRGKTDPGSDPVPSSSLFLPSSLNSPCCDLPLSAPRPSPAAAGHRLSPACSSPAGVQGLLPGPSSSPDPSRHLSSAAPCPGPRVCSVGLDEGARRTQARPLAGDPGEEAARTLNCTVLAASPGHSWGGQALSCGLPRARPLAPCLGPSPPARSCSRLPGGHGRASSLDGAASPQNGEDRLLHPLLRALLTCTDTEAASLRAVFLALLPMGSPRARLFSLPLPSPMVLGKKHFLLLNLWPASAAGGSPHCPGPQPSWCHLSYPPAPSQTEVSPGQALPAPAPLGCPSRDRLQFYSVPGEKWDQRDRACPVAGCDGRTTFSVLFPIPIS